MRHSVRLGRRFGALLGLAATAGFQGLNASVYYTGLNIFLPVPNEAAVILGTFSEEKTQQFSYQDTFGTATAQASAGPGFLKVGSSISTAPSIVGGIYGTPRHTGASAYFTDAITISDSDLNGTQGQMIFTLHVNGLLVADNPNLVAVHPSRGTVAFAGPDGAQILDTWYSANGMHPVNNKYIFSVPFQFGSKFDIGFSLGVTTEATITEIAHGATADFGHSLYWGGISAVLDENGNPLNRIDYTLTQIASDFDYFQSYIPEPSTVPDASRSAGLATFGLIGLHLVRKAKI